MIAESPEQIGWRGVIVLKKGFSKADQKGECDAGDQ